MVACALVLTGPLEKVVAAAPFGRPTSKAYSTASLQAPPPPSDASRRQTLRFSFTFLPSFLQSSRPLSPPFLLRTAIVRFTPKNFSHCIDYPQVLGPPEAARLQGNPPPRSRGGATMRAWAPAALLVLALAALASSEAAGEQKLID